MVARVSAAVIAAAMVVVKAIRPVRVVIFVMVCIMMTGWCDDR